MVWILLDLWYLLIESLSDITMFIEELIDFFRELESVHTSGIYELYLPSSQLLILRVPHER
jgi:hypothetical protein